MFLGSILKSFLRDSVVSSRLDGRFRGRALALPGPDSRPPCGRCGKLPQVSRCGCRVCSTTTMVCPADIEPDRCMCGIEILFPELTEEDLECFDKLGLPI